MTDTDIIELYWQRSENAISETSSKYGEYCGVIARNILFSPEETEECVNDTWLGAWNSIPPNRPPALSKFLGKITRNLAINRLRRMSAEKRGAGQACLCLDELTECVGGGDSVSDGVELRNALNGFLDALSPAHKKMFMQRYWYMYSLSEIADMNSTTENAVKMQLMRTRAALKEHLESEGIEI